MLSSGPYILASPASRPGHTVGHWLTGHPAASLCNLTYLDTRLQIEDWPLQYSPYVGRVYIISHHTHIPVVTYVTYISLMTQLRPAFTLFTLLEHPTLSKVNIAHTCQPYFSKYSPVDIFLTSLYIFSTPTSYKEYSMITKAKNTIIIMHLRRQYFYHVTINLFYF